VASNIRRSGCYRDCRVPYCWPFGKKRPPHPVSKMASKPARIDRRAVDPRSHKRARISPSQQPRKDAMKDDHNNEIQSDVLRRNHWPLCVGLRTDVQNGEPTQVQRDEVFCSRMRAAIQAGLENQIDIRSGPTTGRKEFQTARARAGCSKGDDRDGLSAFLRRRGEHTTVATVATKGSAIVSSPPLSAVAGLLLHRRRGSS
jgi:hypothetical protein